MIAWRYVIILIASVALAPRLGVLSLHGALFDLFLIIGLYPTAARGFREGYLHAWLAGFLLDCTSVGTGVPHCLVFLAAAYVLAVLRSAVELRENPLAQGVALGLISLGLGNLDAIALRMGAGSHATPLIVLAVASAFYTALITPLVYALLDLLPLCRRVIACENIPLGAAGRPRGRVAF